MKNQSFLPSTEKISMQKETRITPRKERLKTTWITHAFQVQNKQKSTHENENTKSGTGATWHRADEIADRWF